MTASAERQITGMRQCGYCGKYAPSTRTECPNCHETFPNLPTVARSRPPLRGEIRRGLLYMFLAGVIHYFAGGHSGMDLPIPISPVVTLYLTPLLFFGGLGFVAYGFVLRDRS
jgi:hypothetical protein